MTLTFRWLGTAGVVLNADGQVLVLDPFFTRPLNKPLRRFARPGRMSMLELVSLAEQSMPGVKVIIPELFKDYTLRESLEGSETTYMDPPRSCDSP